MTSNQDVFKLDIHTLPESRTLDIELELEATPEDVWRALTEAEELVRRFPLQAESTPGVGGKIGIGWDGEWGRHEASACPLRLSDRGGVGRHLRWHSPWLEL